MKILVLFLIFNIFSQEQYTQQNIFNHLPEDSELKLVDRSSSTRKYFPEKNRQTLNDIANYLLEIPKIEACKDDESFLGMMHSDDPKAFERWSAAQKKICFLECLRFKISNLFNGDLSKTEREYSYCLTLINKIKKSN